MKYGIKFPIKEIQFGKSVHMLDLCVYLDEHNIIHYQVYTKPTDAKRYLNPLSFHQKFVFNSIPKQRSVDHLSINDQKENTLIFPVHYFDGITEFKNMVNSLKNEITDLIGENKVMFAMKKKSSVGNMLVRNKQLSLQRHVFKNQMCNSRGCLQCPLNNTRTRFVINGKTVTVPQHLNCKSTNVIYICGYAGCVVRRKPTLDGPSRKPTVVPLDIEVASTMKNGTNQRCPCTLEMFIE